MMGRRAFILLKVGYGRPETAKQAETRMADLPTILRILVPGTKIPADLALQLSPAKIYAGYG
jgi:hypothetical protein